MRSCVRTFSGLVVVAVLILVGCDQDETSMPAVYNKDLGAGQGEVLVPYDAVVSRKAVTEPNQYPLPQMPSFGVAEAAASQGEPDEYTAVARQLVNDLTKGSYDKVTAAFDETMKSRLPAAQVQAMWEVIANQAGAFQEITGVRREQAQVQGQAMEVATATCKFERGSVDVKVVLNAQKQVAGLFTAPANASGSEAAPAEAPAAPPPAPATGAPVPEETPQAPAVAPPAPAAGTVPPAAPRNGSGSGLGDLPPTAPAPVGLGN